MSEQSISRLEHDTGQRLPCTWDDCPSCRRITVTHVRLNDKFRESLDSDPMDGSLIDTAGDEFYDFVVKSWWE